MVIYDIDGKKLLDAILTESAEHEQELSKSDFVKLSWDSDVKITIPAGSYIIPFEDGLKYRLLNAYTPSETDKSFKYTPEFRHPLMWLSRVPFLYVENDLKQQEWSFDGLTVTALEYVCKAINEAFNITDDAQKFTYTLCGTVDGSVSFSVSSNDILSVLSSIAQACKDNNCEWHLSWEHRCLYFGQIAINLGEEVPLLKVHDNIQTASVSESKENYYNCFYPQGSTKNMSRKAQVGTGNVATLARLGLDTTKYPDGCIYIGTDGKVITKAQFEASNAIKQTLALSFDDIFPHIDLYAYNVRKRTRWLKNDATGEYELDGKGNKKTYTVWYMRLAYCTTTKDTTKTLVNTTTDKDGQGNTVTYYWYDYELDAKKQVLQGYTLKGTFKVNTHTTDNKYDALTQSLVGQPSGQDGFELYYHETNETLPASAPTGDSGVNVLKGDYEIVMYQSGDTIIPTNEEDGLIPHGKALPDLTCNIVVLFNIVMGEYETKLAQEELAARTIKEITRRTRDNNNYTAHSNAVEFARKNPNLYIGQKVTYDDGFGYQLPTRVIKLVTKLDYPIIQEITVGNQAVKGPVSQLKEDVNNILSGNFSGAGLNQAQVSNIVRNYTEQRFLSKVHDDSTPHTLTAGGLVSDGGAKVGGDMDVGGESRTSGIANTGDITNTGDIHSAGFERGLLDGTGYGIYKDETGKTVMEIDKLLVRLKAIFAELEIRKTEHTAASRMSTAAHGKLVMTVPVDSEGNVIPEGSSASIYAMRCYMNADDGEKRITNDYHLGDQVFCQTFNIKAGIYKNVSNRYYWRLCVGKGEETVDGKTYNYIDISMVDGAVQLVIDGTVYDCIGCQPGVENDIPAAEDETVQLGSQTDPDRQAAIIENTVGDDAPSYDMLQGISTYSLAGRKVVALGFDSITRHGFMRVYGETYIGSRDRSQYVEFKDGKASVKGMLDVGSKLADGRDVNNLGVTQGNILVNSGFTGDYESVNLDEESSVDEDTEVYSRSLMRWTVSGDAHVIDCSDSASWKAVTGTQATISQSIDGGLTEGKEYILSFKAKNDTVGDKRVSVTIGGCARKFTIASGNGALRFDFPFVCQDTSEDLTMGLDGCILFEPQLMAGNMPMPWTKSHKDNDRAFDELSGLQYLFNAIRDGNTQAAGGLVLSQILKVGLWRDGKMSRETGGMSGAYNNDDSPFLWGGGNLMQAIYTIAKYSGDPGYRPTDEELANMAKIVITHGGRAVLNDVILRGYIHAEGGVFRNVRSANGKWKLAEDGSMSCRDANISGNIYTPYFVIDDGNYADVTTPVVDHTGLTFYSIDLNKTGLNIEISTDKFQWDDNQNSVIDFLANSDMNGAEAHIMSNTNLIALENIYIMLYGVIKRHSIYLKRGQTANLKCVKYDDSYIWITESVDDLDSCAPQAFRGCADFKVGQFVMGDGLQWVVQMTWGTSNMWIFETERVDTGRYKLYPPRGFYALAECVIQVSGIGYACEHPDVPVTATLLEKHDSNGSDDRPYLLIGVFNGITFADGSFSITVYYTGRYNVI